MTIDSTNIKELTERYSKGLLSPEEENAFIQAISNDSDLCSMVEEIIQQQTAPTATPSDSTNTDQPNDTTANTPNAEKPTISQESHDNPTSCQSNQTTKASDSQHLNEDQQSYESDNEKATSPDDYQTEVKKTFPAYQKNENTTSTQTVEEINPQNTKQTDPAESQEVKIEDLTSHTNTERSNSNDVDDDIDVANLPTPKSHPNLIWIVIIILLVGIVLWYFYQKSDKAAGELGDQYRTTMILDEQRNLVANDEKMPNDLKRLFNDMLNPEIRLSNQDLKELDICYQTALDNNNNYTPYADYIGWNLAIAFLQDGQRNKAIQTLNTLKRHTTEPDLITNIDTLQSKISNL
ncbi:MAG: hypothetical protein KBT04_02335 [Bacteroidales bacterium]|nr:hypothetical protein [Candidatus Colimorpha onthohippi]